MMVVAFAVAFAVAAALGACLRVSAAEALDRDLPFGTFILNVAGAFALGILSQLVPPWSTVVGAGAIGAAASWAVTANQVAALARARHGMTAVLYLAATATTGVLACWIGIQLSDRVAG